MTVGAWLRWPRPGPAASKALPIAGRGYSILEIVFVLGLGVTLTAVAVPQSLAGLEELRASGAARYISSRLQQARMEAVMRSTAVGVQFTKTPQGYEYTVYMDGNGNGVLARDIKSGADRPIGSGERLGSHFSGIDFGALPDLPAIDAGDTPPGDDPIRLGAGSLASFSPLGSATPGTLYLRGRGDSQYAVRIFGQTGKTRMLRFDRHHRRWRPM